MCTTYSSNLRPTADLPNDHQICGLHHQTWGVTSSAYWFAWLQNLNLTGTHPDIFTATIFILEFDSRCQQWVNVNLDPTLLGLAGDMFFHGVPRGITMNWKNKLVPCYCTVEGIEKYLANNPRCGTDAIKPLLMGHHKIVLCVAKRRCFVSWLACNGIDS